MLINKELESIQEADLLDLINNKVSERKSFEYQETLSGVTAHQKREFLADVSSFANAEGGDLS